MFEREFPVLTTGRLLLRRITIADAASIYRIFSDCRIAEYDVFTPISSLNAAKGIIASYDKGFAEGRELCWGIARQGSSAIIGTCSFISINNTCRRCEIGFGLVPQEWRKGYMQEALNRIIDYGFRELDFNRIEAFVIPENTASLLLLDKLGFRREGAVREREYFKARFHDEVIMAILREDYCPGKGCVTF